MISLYATLLLGLILRFYNNTAVALWHDEAFSALYIRYPWGEMLRRIILDVHPPLYYLVLRLWSYVFGSSLLSLRGLSILFGVATIYAGYLFILQIYGSRKWALYAALLLAVNPFLIQYSLEARMYTLGTFLLLMSSYLLLKGLESNRRKFWVWYALTATACLYTHYFLFFSVAAQILYILYHLYKIEGLKLAALKSPKFINTALTGVLMLVLYLPWLPSFIEQNQRVQGSYWIPPMDRWAIPSTVFKMALGGQGSTHASALLATALGLAAIYYFFSKTKEQAKWLILAGVVVPFLGSILMSLKTAIYLDRYFVFACLFFVFAIAMAIVQVPRFAWRRTLAVLMVVISLAAFFKNWQDLDIKDSLSGSGIVKKPGMAAAAEVINDQATKNDKIYVGSSFIFFTFKYYNQTSIRPLLYSSGPLETIPHFSGTAILTNEDLVLDFKDTKKNDQIWLLWTTGFGGSKPNVPGNWSLVSQNEFEDTPGFKGKIIVTQYHVN